MRHPTALILGAVAALVLFNCADKPLTENRFVVDYIVDGKMIAETVRGDLKKKGLQIHKQMKSREAFVVLMDSEAAEELSDKYTVRKDLIYTIDSGCKREEDEKPDLPDDKQPTQVATWGYGAVFAEEAFQRGYHGEGVIVCVVDTGIDKDHPDLEANIIGGEDFTGVGDYEDDNGHGSHVAGIIGAVDNSIGVRGVADRVGLLAHKVLDSDGSGYSSDIADAISACVVRGADVINLSLGGSEPSDLVGDAIDFAVLQGVHVIAAAGNNGAEVGYPAARDNVVAVSSMNRSYGLSGFSSRGPEITYIAPGSDIYSTVNGNDYDTYNGTSMAAPFVAGVFALAVESGNEVVAGDVSLPEEHQGLGLVHAGETVGF